MDTHSKKIPQRNARIMILECGNIDTQSQKHTTQIVQTFPQNSQE